MNNLGEYCLIRHKNITFLAGFSVCGDRSAVIEVQRQACCDMHAATDLHIKMRFFRFSYVGASRKIRLYPLGVCTNDNNNRGMCKRCDNNKTSAPGRERTLDLYGIYSI